MDLLTIFNYENASLNEKNLFYIWMKQVHKHNDIGSSIYVLSEFEEPEFSTSLKVGYGFNYNWVKLNRSNGNKFSYLKPHNVDFKLYNLTNWERAYIFIDIDAFLFGDLSFLNEKSKDKPWIGIDHQIIPYHTDHMSPFLNSGVQIVSDVNFLNYNDILNKIGKYTNLLCPGADQSIIFTYFKEIDYDYTHKDIPLTWNSCAGYSSYDDKTGNFFTHPTCNKNKSNELISTKIKEGEKVFINHYWYDFKPWNINCLFFNKNKIF